MREVSEKSLKQYFVTAILSKPKKMELKLDDLAIHYWGVEVLMVCDGAEIESIVTFDKLHKAKKLQIGDAFER